VRLGIFDALAGGSKAASAIAEQLNLDPALPYRLLRALGALELMQEDGKRRFSLTDAGDLFRKDHPQTLRGVTLLEEGPEHYALWKHLPAMVRDGKRNAFMREFGRMAFDHAAHDPAYADVFNEAMSSYSSAQTAWVLEALDSYDFSSVAQICDVGGGHGYMPCSLLVKYPHLKGTVLELPCAIENEALLWADRLDVGDPKRPRVHPCVSARGATCAAENSKSRASSCTASMRGHKYGMPALRQNGILIYYAAFRRRIGLYPPIVGDPKLKKAVSRYAGEKGNLRFPLDQPIPFDLIARIARHRAEQDAAKFGAKAAKPAKLGVAALVVPRHTPRRGSSTRWSGECTARVSMPDGTYRTICWLPTWNENRRGMGMEHLLLAERLADSVVLAFDERSEPFRLTYRLTWGERWSLHSAEHVVATQHSTRSLALRSDGKGQWQHADGGTMDELDGCMNIDIWPTPFTNSFPIRRVPMAVGERRQVQVAWISAPDLTVCPKTQAYTRLGDRLYLFEDLDGSGFKAELAVDEDGIVLDYPPLFRRIGGV
jgi:hypothetical protein